ncbi:MAG TPA: aromatic ring-hydroxylating dioxygenase subunit alpha [Candidatus Baltobacteraceae bacterium]|nr:aromatic ring-hydroxylating dioxygenase subunit alpha [Candidatus Baltobacteraceae bacterium]
MGDVTVQALERSLPRAAYLDAAFFEREKRAIFWDQWVCVGRADRVSATGDFQVIDIAGESVILLRGRAGALYAHLNFCRHRGSRLLCGQGRLQGGIRCPYHAWTYRLDGTLAGAPFVPMQAIPESARRLHAVAVDTWGGFAFVHLDPRRAIQPGETLADQLGRIPQRLARYPLHELRTARTIAYDVAANWKVLLENYNECYHCAGVHPELCRVVPAFARGGAGLDWDSGIPQREGTFTFTFSGTTTRKPFANLNDDERVRHNGELIYPNFMLSLSADHVAAFTLWPQSPDRTRIVCDFLFHPDEMSRAAFDPSDAVEFWDLVNRQDWDICERVQAGMTSRAFEFGYYAPMEDASLDIRRYIARRLGDE